MGNNFQQVIIVGNVGRDSEMRYTPSGQAVTTFSVAVNRTWVNNKGEQCNETAWFRCAAWGKLAEVCNQYVKKGMLVLVQGRLTPDRSTGAPRIYTKQDGTPATSFELAIQEVKFLTRIEGAPQDAVADVQPVEDDIPF